MEIDEVIEELYEYISVEGTEISEMLRGLIYLQGSYCEYMINEDIEDLLEEEIRKQLEWFKKNTFIKEEETTYTETHKELFYNSDFE